MQCEICRGDMKEYKLVEVKFVDGHKEIVVRESEPIYFVYKDDHIYKCCKDCWRKYE